jgi:hypothetical protein
MVYKIVLMYSYWIGRCSCSSYLAQIANSLIRKDPIPDVISERPVDIILAADCVRLLLQTLRPH